MKAKIILVGKAASGKDHLRSKMIEKGLTPDISLTTRPPREGEKHAVDYYFISEEEFAAVTFEDHFYESVEFNGWKYGTLFNSWKSNDVFIMTPKGISQISEEDRKSCFVIYLDIPMEIRRERLMERSDADKVERRIEADEADFKNFTDYDLRITNENF